MIQIQNTALKRLLLAISSSVLLFLGWQPLGWTLFLFLGFLPLLLLEEDIRMSVEKNKGKKLFFWALLSFGLWTLFTNYWIYFAHWSGMVAAIFVNGLLMSLVWWMFHKTSVFLSPKKGRIALVVYWLTFEYFHLDWDLSYPWMMLGNGLTPMIHHIQFYEYTGVLGGTLWIICLNLVVLNYYKKLKAYPENRKTIHLTFLILVAILINFPLLIKGSVGGKLSGLETEKINVVVVQPNLDPYSEKFERNNLDQVAYFETLVSDALLSKTDFVIFPETALPDGFYEDNLEHDGGIRSLQYWIEQHPQLQVLCGASSYDIYQKGDEIPLSARPINNGAQWYDAFNTAVFLQSGQYPALYHKSKLVAGVEMMPFEKAIKPLLGDVAIDLGGIVGALGTQTERTVFDPSGLGAAPVICYESIYGEYMSGYIRNGAKLIAIITNDGWWGNTAGHKQHFEYARLRAIESRRYVVRSANTGISGIIDYKGEVLEQLNWDIPGVLSAEVSLIQEKTFYTKYGDYLGRIPAFMAALFIAYLLAAWRLRKGSLPLPVRFE